MLSGGRSCLRPTNLLSSPLIVRLVSVCSREAWSRATPNLKGARDTMTNGTKVIHKMSRGSPRQTVIRSYSSLTTSGTGVSRTNPSAKNQWEQSRNEITLISGLRYSHSSKEVSHDTYRV